MHGIELFAGAGGLAMGLHRAGISPRLIVERDRWCCETLSENRRLANSEICEWPETISTDVRDVDFRKFEGIDLISGGPPCQPFSIGGKHKAHKDSRDMWSEAVRSLRESSPKAFIFENVKGLKRQAFATYLDYIILQLEYPSLKCRSDEAWADHLRRLQQHHTGGGKLEYRVVCELKNAADYGVPQKRERVIFVGFRADIEANWSFPNETHSLDALLFEQFNSKSYWDRHEISKRVGSISDRGAVRAKKIQSKPTMLPWRTVRDALIGLPDPEENKKDSQEFLNHRFQVGARAYAGHTGSYLDEPAKTLKAGVHGVPGGENMMRRANGSVRYFTVRESARLQTFPDNYVLHGSWSEAMRQLGNAVPVTLAEIVAKSVRDHLLVKEPF